VVLCYDVSEDRRRNRLARAVSRYLTRVQKSTFEGPLSADALDRLRVDALKIIDAETDSVRVYFLCAGCDARTVIIGTGTFVEEPEDVLF
jgi:CRISPR-associated protein Cas2